MESKEIFNQQVKLAVETLRDGGTLLYPTDTVWGIGCDACNRAAVEKVYKLKHRDDSKALIVLVDSVAMLERYVDEIPEVAYQLLEAAVKPMTIVYDRGINLVPNLLAEDGSIGIRVTTDPFCCAVIRGLRKPLVSTSANISGDPTPASFNDISSEIKSGVDHIVDLRHNEVTGSVSSSVIKLSAGGEIKILRP